MKRKRTFKNKQNKKNSEYKYKKTANCETYINPRKTLINSYPNIQKKIIDFFNENPHAITIEMLIDKINISSDEYMPFFDTLRSMESCGEIMYTKKGRIARPQDIGFVTGIYNKNKRISFIKTEKNEIPVSTENREGAMHGDFVLAKPVYSGKNIKAQIVDIISHNTNELTGIFYEKNDGNYVISSNRKFDAPIKIIYGKEHGAKHGDRVIAKILHHSSSSFHKGEITAVFGQADSLDANYFSTLACYNIKTDFSNESLSQAKILTDTIPDCEYEKRCDLRSMNIFTIDSAESKDLDDAVSIEKEPDGWLLGVHIADVSHYVSEKSPIDIEAYTRGTSVYFADKVIPMLPKELSNGICSLNPNEDRLAISVFMHINSSGEVIRSSIKKSIIRSKVKGIYSEINSILENNAPDNIIKKYADLLADLDSMYSLARVLEKSAQKRGALDFNIPEAKVIINSGKVIDITKRERGISDRIIEEFMVICNQTVAKFMSKGNFPCIYRTHQSPSEDKAQEFIKFVSLLGFKISDKNGKINNKNIQKLLHEITGTEYEQALSAMTLRSMSKAIYKNENDGHFGLALKDYLHFTSPIRRYPDLMVHRILTKILDNNINDIAKYRSICAETAVHSSECEVRALNAERDITKLYMIVYLQDKIGEIFDAEISGVTDFGLFVQLDNTIEGLIHISDLRDDYYEFYKDQMLLRGRRHKNVYALGNSLKVKLIKADITSRQIDFIISDE